MCHFFSELVNHEYHGSGWPIIIFVNLIKKIYIYKKKNTKNIKNIKKIYIYKEDVPSEKSTKNSLQGSTRNFFFTISLNAQMNAQAYICAIIAMTSIYVCTYIYIYI